MTGWNQSTSGGSGSLDCRKISKTNLGRLDVLVVSVLPKAAVSIRNIDRTSFGLRSQNAIYYFCS